MLTEYQSWYKSLPRSSGITSGFCTLHWIWSSSSDTINMADFQPPSPGGQADDGATSSLSNAATTPAFGGQPTYGRSHRLQSREASCGTTPSQSGRATPNDPEAEVAHRLQELTALRQGQAEANANMERFMSMNSHILESMRSSQD